MLLFTLAACAKPDVGQGIGTGVDWSLGARLINRLEVESNRDLEPGEQDALVTKAVQTGLILDAETKRALFSADLGIAAQYHVGADEDFDGEGRVDPALRLRHLYTGKTHTVDTRANFSLRATDATQLEDTGTIEADATQLTAGVLTRVEQRLNDSNRLIGELSADIVAFDKDLDSLVPSQSYTIRGGWAQDLNVTDRADLTGAFTYFKADNDEQARNQVFALTAGLASQRTPRHNTRLRLGSALVRSNDALSGTSPGFDIALLGLAGLEYELARWRTALEVSQEVQPSSAGAVQAFTRAGGRLQYVINPRETFAAELSYLRRAPLSGSSTTSQSITFNPSYALALTPDAQLSLDYFFRLNDGSTGIGSGHRITLSLTQNFDLLH